jgi:hypothetical protein
LTKHFNTGDVEVYLISTTAGGLGLNLPGANRVIIFDFKFNPIQEEQAVGRAYRIGQKKPTFVYRFVVAGTFEDTVHNKTIYKMQLASRVVDKKNPIAHAKKNISDFLFEPRDIEQQDLSNFEGSDPKVLDRILASQKHANTIRAIVQSDTFEKDDDDKLTAEEEKEVKQLLIDERLKRSDPQAYQELLDKRERIRLRRAAQTAQAAAQASKPVPTAMNSGPHNRAIPTTPQAPTGTAGQGQAPPMHQRKLSTQGPTVGAGTPKAIGNMPTPISSKLMPSANPAGAATPKTKPPLNAAPIAGNSGSATSAAIKPPGKGIQDSDSSKDSVSETSSSNQVVTAVSAVSSGAKENQSTSEAVSSSSALPNKNLKDAQLSASYVTPDRPASERVPQLGLPQSPHSSSTSRMTDSESKVRRVEAVLAMQNHSNMRCRTFRISTLCFSRQPRSPKVPLMTRRCRW